MVGFRMANYFTDQLGLLWFDIYWKSNALEIEYWVLSKWNQKRKKERKKAGREINENVLV